MPNTKLTALTETTTLADTDLLYAAYNVATTPESRKIALSSLKALLVAAMQSGWIAISATLTYSSADAPSFIVSSNADLTAVLGVGMRVKLTHAAAVKYFIVTAIGSWSGSAQLITLYGGTDYTLAGTAITLPYFSTVKAPLGFPLDPSKWTVSASDTGNAAKSSPAQNTWYGGAGLSAAGISISLPIGVWRVQFKGLIEIVTPSTQGGYGVRWTFSTANNSESDASWTGQGSTFQTAVASTQRWTAVSRLRTVALAAKTTYYLDILTGQASVTTIAMRGDVAATEISAISAYL